MRKEHSMYSSSGEQKVPYLSKEYPVVQTATAQRNQRRRHLVKKTAKTISTPTPSSLYAMPGFPEIGQEFTLHAVNARVDILMTPQTIQEFWLRNDQDEFYREFVVSGYTDRDGFVSFSAQTVPGMEDEIRLVEKPVFL